MITTLVNILQQYSFAYSTEYDLQDSLEQIFAANNLPYKREHVLSEDSQIDFMIQNTGIEVKVKGSPDTVWKQIKKYLNHVDNILLITNRPQHKQIENHHNNVKVYVITTGI